MSLKRLFLFSGLATVCFAILLLIDRFQPALLTHFRNLERDAISRAGRRAAANPDLVFMAIDSDSVTLDTATDVHELYGLTTNDSIETRALQLMSQAWPWPREVYALVLQRLIDAGAKVVALDLTFPTATPDDPILRTTLDRYRDKVVIGSNFISAASHGYAVIDASLTRPSESLSPQTTPTDEDEVVRQAQSSYCRFPSAPITTILPRKNSPER